MLVGFSCTSGMVPHTAKEVSTLVVRLLMIILDIQYPSLVKENYWQWAHPIMTNLKMMAVAIRKINLEMCVCLNWIFDVDSQKKMKGERIKTNNRDIYGDFL